VRVERAEPDRLVPRLRSALAALGA
jgi:hypothetical protein